MNYYEIWRLPQVKHNSKSKITKTKRQNGKSQNWFRKPSLLLAFSPLCTVKFVHINICLIRRWLDTTSNLLTTFYLRGFFVVAELKKSLWWRFSLQNLPLFISFDVLWYPYIKNGKNFNSQNWSINTNYR